MSDDRPTTWTRMEPERDHWQRWTVDAWESVRMLAFEARGGWTFAVDAFRGLAHGRIYDPWDHEDGEIEARPALPSRELAQAAAEEWVREWASGLIAAVGKRAAPTAEDRAAAEIERSDAVDRLIDALGDAAGMTDAELDTEIRAFGYDPAKVLAGLRMTVKMCIAGTGRCSFACPHRDRCTLDHGHDGGHNFHACDCNEPLKPLCSRCGGSGEEPGDDDFNNKETTS